MNATYYIPCIDREGPSITEVYASLKYSPPKARKLVLEARVVHHYAPSDLSRTTHRRRLERPGMREVGKP